MIRHAELLLIVTLLVLASTGARFQNPSVPRVPGHKLAVGPVWVGMSKRELLQALGAPLHRVDAHKYRAVCWHYFDWSTVGRERDPEVEYVWVDRREKVAKIWGHTLLRGTQLLARTGESVETVYRSLGQPTSTRQLSHVSHLRYELDEKVTVVVKDDRVRAVFLNLP